MCLAACLAVLVHQQKFEHTVSILGFPDWSSPPREAGYQQPKDGAVSNQIQLRLDAFFVVSARDMRLLPACFSSWPL